MKFHEIPIKTPMTPPWFPAINAFRGLRGVDDGAAATHHDHLGAHGLRRLEAELHAPRHFSNHEMKHHYDNHGSFIFDELDNDG